GREFSACLEPSAISRQLSAGESPRWLTADHWPLRPCLTPLRAIGGDLAVDLDHAEEGAVGLLDLGRGDGRGARLLAVGGPGPQDAIHRTDGQLGGVAALAPELLDRADAPLSALARGPDRLIADHHAYRVGVHLREMAQGHPTAAVDLDVVEREVMRL